MAVVGAVDNQARHPNDAAVSVAVHSRVNELAAFADAIPSRVADLEREILRLNRELKEAQGAQAALSAPLKARRTAASKRSRLAPLAAVA